MAIIKTLQVKMEQIVCRIIPIIKTIQLLTIKGQ